MKEMKDLHYYCYDHDFYFVLCSHSWGKSKDICNAKDDLDSTHWDGHNSPLTSSSRPLISAVFSAVMNKLIQPLLKRGENILQIDLESPEVQRERR